MAAEDLGAAMARLLLDAGAIQVSHDRPFILTAGWASPVYVDCRRLLGQPRLRGAAVGLAVAYLAGVPSLRFGAVAGGETAGIPWATLIADRLALPSFYVRKRPLGIGRNAQVEGGSADGLEVLLVDDLATDGGSKVAFARGLRMAGASLTDALVLFHNRAFPAGAGRLERLGVTLHALADWSDVLLLDHAGLTEADRAMITGFLAAPAAWSEAHGGRRVIG